MSKQIARAEQFRKLHVPHNPIILYNIWDAGSANAVARAGAKALATGSWSVAAAQGYADGEEMPLGELLAVVRRITQTADLPLSVDFEGGYAVEPEGVMQNVHRLLDLGVVGLNFEDQVVNGPGLHNIDDQVARLRAVRRAMDEHGIPGFINARTDIFLKATQDIDHRSLMDEAITRGVAYAKAGADGFFVPGLKDKNLIQEICAESTLPVNVMMTGDVQSIAEFAALGVARISFGPGPYRTAIAELEKRARTYY